MLARTCTFVVWALVAAAALFWGLKLFVAAPAAPRETTLVLPGTGVRGDLTRLLGADAPAAPVLAAAKPVADARFQLIGVVSPRSSRAASEGLALIAVDGKPPKAFRIGAVVDGDTVLQSVQARSASLGLRGGVSQVSLQIPAVAPPATGSIPASGPLTLPPGTPALVGLRPVGPGLPGWRPPATPTFEVDAPVATEPTRGVTGPQLR